MHLAIRVDATARMGTGHFMRCLTLADSARAAGAHVRVVSRDLPVHLRAMVSERGHEFAALPDRPPSRGTNLGETYARWLGVSPAEDAASTIDALADRVWDWLVADHYALDASWETALRRSVTRILVIDDLANRAHDCDILLDQNLCTEPAVRYQHRVSAGCQLLLGPRYALGMGGIAALTVGSIGYFAVVSSPHAVRRRTTRRPSPAVVDRHSTLEER